MAIYRIGTAFVGKVEEIGPGSIRTKFFVFGVPVVPLGSFFVHARMQEQFDGPPVEMLEAFPIALNLKSVLVGCFLGVRGWSLSLLLLSCSPLWLEHSENPFLLLLPLLIALSFPVGLVLKRAEGANGAKRRRLLKVTGISILPEVLPPDVRASVLKDLEAAPQRNDPDWRHAYLAYGGNPRGGAAGRTDERQV